MSDLENKFRQLAEFEHTNKLQAKDNYKFQSRRRLEKTISTKLDTTMIGSISEVEKALGFLWGHGKKRDELSDQERRYLTLWDELRTAILNNGNNQKRAAISEIRQYDVEWQRHHFDAHVKGRKTNE